MSSMLRNVGGNGTEPRVLVYQSKKGTKEIRNVVKKNDKGRGNFLFLHLMVNVAQGY